MNRTLVQRKENLRETFPDLRNDLTEEEIEEMEEIRLAMERRALLIYMEVISLQKGT